jgi:hypothetical protein
MRFGTHLVTAAIAGFVQYPRSPLRVAGVVAAGTLIDLDHWVLYALRTGDWSLAGALNYDRYRYRPGGAGDNRPRYGSLRSWLHLPFLVLPLGWLAAYLWRPTTPLALGLTVHLVLDNVDWPMQHWLLVRAGHRCQHCGRFGPRLHILTVRYGGAWHRSVVCRVCADRVVKRGPAPAVV